MVFKPVNFVVVMLLICLLGCGGEKPKSTEFDINSPSKAATSNRDLASERIDLKNTGVGPVQTIELDSTINMELANAGKSLYEEKCIICHKPYEKFIGPAPHGILKRRTPEWVMNMMLNPDIMLKQDPLAKDLFLEFNGSPMTNQNLSEDEARAILEYFRTL